jgi:hypothetical protein
MKSRDLVIEARAVKYTSTPRADRKGENPASIYAITRIHPPTVLVVFVMWCTHEYNVRAHAQYKHIPCNSRMRERETLPLPMNDNNPHLYEEGGSRKHAHRHKLVATLKPPPYSTNRRMEALLMAQT